MKYLYRYYWLYLFLSLVFILSGVLMFFRSGLRLSIDFTGGVVWELSFPSGRPSEQEFIELVGDEIRVVHVQLSSTDLLELRAVEMSVAQKEQVFTKVQAKYPTVTERRFEVVGPLLGRELIIKTLIAVILIAVVIALFIMYQFSELKFGIAAVTAMFHDSAILFTVFLWLGELQGIEIDVLFVTAVLTTLSFSIHDTIVTFHRIRELLLKHKGWSLREAAQAAVVQTLSRSLNNSFTIVIVLVSLVWLGGESVRSFAIALLTGAITGTYSSIFTAIPLLLLWEDVKKRFKGNEKGM